MTNIKKDSSIQITNYVIAEEPASPSPFIGLKINDSDEGEILEDDEAGIRQSKLPVKMKKTIVYKPLEKHNRNNNLHFEENSPKIKINK